METIGYLEKIYIYKVASLPLEVTLRHCFLPSYSAQIQEDLTFEICMDYFNFVCDCVHTVYDNRKLITLSVFRNLVQQVLVPTPKMP
jgi:hypothetical protein